MSLQGPLDSDPEQSESVTFVSVHGDGRTGASGPSYYTPADYERCSRIFEEVTTLREQDPGAARSPTCDFCKRFLSSGSEWQRFEHQPGLKSLYLSSLECRICSLLLDILFSGILFVPDAGGRDVSNVRGQHHNPVALDSVDSIGIAALTTTMVQGDVLQRFVLQWSGRGFQWTGDLFGIVCFSQQGQWSW